MGDPFAALGLRAGASVEQVKAAFRAAALRDHPDRLAPTLNTSERALAAERFKAATEAYELLSDERKRSAFEAAARYGGYGSGGGGGSAGSYRGAAGVNTDWSRAGTSYRGGSGGGSSRASPWQRLRRTLTTQAFSAGALVLLLGAAVAGLQLDAIWEARNRDKLRPWDKLRPRGDTSADASASGGAAAAVASGSRLRGVAAPDASADDRPGARGRGL